MVGSISGQQPRPPSPDAAILVGGVVEEQLIAALTAALRLDFCVLTFETTTFDDDPDGAPYQLSLPIIEDGRHVATIIARRSTPFADNERATAQSICVLARGIAGGAATATPLPPFTNEVPAHMTQAELPAFLSRLIRSTLGRSAVVMLGVSAPGPSGPALLDSPAMLPPEHPARGLFAENARIQVIPLGSDGDRHDLLYLGYPGNHPPATTTLTPLVSRVVAIINQVRAEEMSSRQAALQALLADATEILLSAQDLPTTLDALARRAAGVLGDGISITVIEPGGEKYACVVAAHVDPIAADLIHRAASLYPRGAGMSAEARRRHQVLIGTLDPAHTPPTRFPLLHEAGVRRAMSVPLRGAAGSSGNLVVYATRETTLLDQTAIQFATILGDRIGDVLTRHDLLATAEQQAAQLEALLRSAQVVARQRDLNAMLDAIADEIDRIIPADQAVIFGVDQDANALLPRIHRWRAQAGSPKPGPQPIPIGQGLSSTVLQTRQASYFPDAHLRPESFYSEAMRPYVQIHGESVLIAPLSAAEEIIGILFVSRFGSDRFTPAEFKLFQLFAGQAASALQQAAALEDERHHRRQAETMARLTAALAYARTTADIVPAIAQAAADLCGFDHVWVLLDAGGDDRGVEIGGLPFSMIAGIDASPSILRRWLADLPATDTGPHLIEDLKALPPGIVQAVETSACDGAIVAPLVAGTRLVGAIVIWDSQRHSLTSLDLATLGAAASQAAAEIARLQADRSLAEQLQMTTALRRAAEIAFDAHTEDEAIAQFAMLLPEAIAARGATIWLVDAGGDTVSLRAHVRNGALQPAPAIPPVLDLSLGLPQLGEWHSPEPSIVPNIDDMNLPDAIHERCVRNDVRALVLVPIFSPDSLIGVVALDYAQASDLPNETGVTLAAGIARQIGIGLATMRLRERRRILYRSSVEALAATVDARDPFTHTHSRNVAHYSRLIAERLSLPRQQIEQIELAGLLHDIGKIGLSDRILTKTGPLDPDERMVMMAHSTRGAEILSGSEDLAALVPIVRHHHERYDGFGYPDGLVGNAIPLGAAIVGVADAFDGMISDRSQLRQRPASAALEELRRAAGRQFHPSVVAALEAAVEEDPQVVRQPQIDEPIATGAARRTGLLPAAEVTQVRVLSRIARELGALTDLTTFVERARAIVATELRYDQIEIFLREPGFGALETGALGDGDCARVARHAIETGKIAHLGDIEIRPGVDAAVLRGIDPRSIVAVPLVTEGEILGALCASQPRVGAFFASDEELLVVAADQLAAAVRVAQLHDEIKWAARHDGLTEAVNRRAFYQELTLAIETQRQQGVPISMILCDVDGLKQVNDQMGHLAGDQVLKSLVSRIREMVRPSDIIARYGGDEFALITYSTSREQAEFIGRRLRASLQERPLITASWNVLVTAGVAQLGEDGDTPAELVACADARLYRARGRRKSR